jgi:hypothetical protein
MAGQKIRPANVAPGRGPCLGLGSGRKGLSRVIIAWMVNSPLPAPIQFKSVRMMCAILAVGFGFAGAGTLKPLAQSRSTAAASGRVIDGVTNQPIAGAFVTIGPAARTAGQPTIVADDQGRFMFRDLPAGTFELAAAARGYLAGDGGVWSGAVALPTTAVELADGEQRSGVTVPLWPPARISGTIRDDLGDPIEGAQVGVLRVEYVAGNRRLRVVGAAISDDSGSFRAGRLRPGSYVVGAIMRRTTIPVSFRELLDRLTVSPAAEQSVVEKSLRGSGAVADFRMSGYRVGSFIIEPGMGGAAVGPAPSADGNLLSGATLFYPGLSSPAQAQAVAVGPGEDRRGIDLTVRLTKSSRVSGRVVGPDGPVQNIGVALLPEGYEALMSDDGFEQSTTISNQAGEFTFLGVPEGSYVARAYVIPPAPQANQPSAAARADEATLSGNVGIIVRESDVANVQLTLRKGPSVQGRLVFEGTKATPTAQQLAQGSIRFELADGRAPASPPMPPIRTAIDSTGGFRSLGLPNGTYVLRVGGFQGWTLESAMFNGRDVSDVGLDTETATTDFTGLVVTLTDAPATVTGTVRTPAGAAAAQATVVLFSTNSTDWTNRGASPRRLIKTSTSRDGSFSLAGLLHGEYFALATADGLPDDWSMPQFLRTLSAAASKVTVERRATRTVALTAISLPRGGSR